MMIAHGGLITTLKPGTIGFLLLSFTALPPCPETTHSYQEPVDIHEEQGKQECVEEEVERDVGNRLDAGDAGSPHHFKGEPVQTEPKPAKTRKNKLAHMCSQIHLSSFLQTQYKD